MDEPVAPVESPRHASEGEPVEAGARSLWRSPLRFGVLLLIVAVISLLGWATLSAGRGRSLVARIAAGESPRAPGFELEAVWPESGWPRDLAAALRDGRLSLDELRGRPTVINFWASWCLACRDEAPILNASSKTHAGQVRFVGIDVQDLRGDALAFLRKFDVPYVTLRDKADKTYGAYGLTGVPETYYLDAQGRIVAHSPGAISRASLERGIEAALTGGER